MVSVPLGLEPVGQRCKGELGVAHQTHVHWIASADMTAVDIDLDALGFIGIEVLVWKIGSDHQQQIGPADRLDGGASSEEPETPDRHRVVVG